MGLVQSACQLVYDHLVSLVPAWAKLGAVGVLFLLLLGFVIVIIRRIQQGDELKFSGFTLAASRLNTQLYEAFNNLRREYHTIYDHHERKRELLVASRDALIDLLSYEPAQDENYPLGLLRQGADLILHVLASALGHDARNPHRFAFFTLDRQTRSLRFLPECSRGFSGNTVNTRRLPLDGSAAGWTFQTGKTYHNDHLSSSHDPLFRLRTDGTFPYESLVCAVVLGPGGQPVGVLSVDAKQPNSFSDEEVFYVEHAAAMLGVFLTVGSMVNVGDLTAFGWMGEDEDD